MTLALILQQMDILTMLQKENTQFTLYIFCYGQILELSVYQC